MIALEKILDLSFNLLAQTDATSYDVIDINNASRYNIQIQH